MTEDLSKTRQERDAAQADLAAYKATGVTPQQILGMNEEFKSAPGQLGRGEYREQDSGAEDQEARDRAGCLRDPDYFVTLPADLKGKVLVADPKWNFVVLNVGEDQGVLERGELLVNRNGKLVAKVIVRSVQKDRCIANVLPGWELGEVMEGDQVIPAHPAS